jgi:hypothetical protein
VPTFVDRGVSHGQCSRNPTAAPSCSISQASLAGVVTGHKLEDRVVGVKILTQSRLFSSPHCADQLWGPLSLLSNGTRHSSPWVRRLGHKAIHSLPARANVMKTWIYTPLPHTSSWHNAWLVKHRDKWSFPLLFYRAPLLTSLLMINQT